MNAESTREALDVASLAGDILLASGAEIFRVEETIALRGRTASNPAMRLY